MATTMARSNGAVDYPVARGNGHDHRRRVDPLDTADLSSMNYGLSLSKMHSPPPTPGSPPPWPDRLSLRLRSNSGLKLHQNDAALSQYTDYKVNGLSRHSSISPAPQSDATSSSARSPSLTSRRSMTWTTSALTSCLSYLDFLGKDLLQMVMDDPTALRHLVKYCEDQGCEEDIDFLLKIRQYAQSTNEVASVLANISTTYTALGATSPISLPAMLSRPLNADIKRIAHSTLPSLETVFSDARSYVEDRVGTEIFPDFVKSQLIQSTATVLAKTANGPSSRLLYPGLGKSFCLTDALDPENPVLSASDGFASVTGHPLADVLGQNCGFLKGPFTDPEAVRRIQAAVKENREAIELILNHRKDGEPFWNLLFLFPLKDRQGTVQYWLGAQVNVSESIRNRGDMLQVLSGGSPPNTQSADGSNARSDESSAKGSAKEGRPQSGHSRSGSRGFSSRSRLFQTFRKPPTPPSPPLPQQDPKFSDPPPLSSSKLARSSRFSTQRFHPRAHVQLEPTAYSHYILLRCAHPAQQASGQQQQQQQPAHGSSGAHKPTKQSIKMTVAYHSDAAVDLLSIRADISNADIFHVLAEKANSPSVTRGFKSVLRERVQAGKCSTVEVLLDRSRTGTLLGKRRNSVVGLGTRPSVGDLDDTRPDDKKAGKKHGQERIMSHWTPLKDASGRADWVLLLLTPGV